jgi:hypothetical protein
MKIQKQEQKERGGLRVDHVNMQITVGSTPLFFLRHQE